MDKDLTDSVARAFVELVWKYRGDDGYGWKAISVLPEEDAGVLSDTVEAAGFKVGMVTPGVLRGHYLDQDGSATGETYAINHLCPYIVMSFDDGPDYMATGWLDNMVSFTLVEFDRGGSIDTVVARIAEQIAKSRPLEPIQLTAEGDKLIENSPSPGWFGYEYFVTHRRDDDDLPSMTVGVHAHCNGYIDRVAAAATHDALVCRRCHLRVSFPKGIVTFGELRDAKEEEFLAAAPL